MSASTETTRSDDTVRGRIGIALVVITLVIAALVTLSPFCFTFHPRMLSRIDWRLYYPGHNDRDLILNLLMLAPLGIGLALVRTGRAPLRRIALEAAALGIGFAVIVETLQIFERGRYPQVADVWRNGVGCVVGAIVAGFILRWLDRR